jgi:ATP-dependent DNA helicase 2 subunit 2
VVKTITGKPLDKHRNIPTHDMEKFMSDYVDSMDISEFGKDDDGYANFSYFIKTRLMHHREPTKYAPVEDTFSPIIHRINQCIRHRAMNPEDPLPPPYEILTKYAQPPEELLEKSRGYLEKLTKACDVKKGRCFTIMIMYNTNNTTVETKVQSKKRGREQPKPKSGLDVSPQILPSECDTDAHSSNPFSTPPPLTKRSKFLSGTPFQSLNKKLVNSPRNRNLETLAPRCLFMLENSSRHRSRILITAVLARS